ncbi:uncharacterized protein LOC108629399 isoform X1 [Ceratina calcarata]|uniref:Uncharacterized protein LOC108629399 isoform X1 n=1 Tax=Ceratina calcarata TaxID=156304 RepID=A0AAJ7WE73_9HYME|nr:uncharacterized protein LOC108629399 isoform X1 [Ceratina calcarata]
MKRILIVDSNYVQFRNFKLKKSYKKTITLQNVSTIPARFQIESRPYRSKFQVTMKPVIENRSVIAPGLQMKLNITFRCDHIDSPEELLLINVEHGSPLAIRMHGYKEPPLLLGYCLAEEIQYYSDTRLHRSWYSVMVESFSSKSTNSTTSSDKTEFSCETEDNTFVSMTFDCKKGFVGEQVSIPMRFKNIGGTGRFFIMSETDWFAMDIVVEKLYILCDNCSLLATEIIGDGLMYEPDFIQFSKVSILLIQYSTLYKLL